MEWLSLYSICLTYRENAIATGYNVSLLRTISRNVNWNFNFKLKYKSMEYLRQKSGIVTPFIFRGCIYFPLVKMYKNPIRPYLLTDRAHFPSMLLRTRKFQPDVVNNVKIHKPAILYFNYSQVQNQLFRIILLLISLSHQIQIKKTFSRFISRFVWFMRHTHLYLLITREQHMCTYISLQFLFYCDLRNNKTYTKDTYIYGTHWSIKIQQFPVNIYGLSNVSFIFLVARTRYVLSYT